MLQIFKKYKFTILKIFKKYKFTLLKIFKNIHLLC